MTLFVRCLLLVSFCSWLVAFSLFLVSFCSFLVTFYLLLDKKFLRICFWVKVKKKCSIIICTQKEKFVNNFKTRIVLAICKSRNGESENGMSGMMGMREIRVGMRGMGMEMLGMRGILGMGCECGESGWKCRGPGWKCGESIYFIYYLLFNYRWLKKTNNNLQNIIYKIQSYMTANNSA